MTKNKERDREKMKIRNNQINKRKTTAMMIMASTAKLGNLVTKKKEFELHRRKK